MNFTKITRNQYRELFNRTKFSTFFHNADWHEFLEKQFRWIFFEYYLYGSEIIFPIAKFRIFNKEKIISLPFCEYGGPLILNGEINLQEFEKDVFKEFGERIKVKFHPQILQISNLEPITHNLEPRTSNLTTHWLENFKNKSAQEIWDSFRKTLRHEIKHAQDQNLVVRKCENLKELKKFYNLYVANLRRKKTIPYPWLLIQFLYKNAPSELLLVFDRDKIVGGSLFVEYSGFVHYFLSASDQKHKNLGANYLILWNKIESLVGQDIILDLGATPKNSSLFTFKSGWGGKEYPIIILKKEKNPEKLRSSRVRNLFILLPNFIIKLLSPILLKYRI